MWYKQGLFKTGVTLLLFLLILFITIQVIPVLTKLFQYAIMILLPIIIAGVLYYILRPLRRRLEANRIPRYIAIIILYVLVFICMSLLITYLWPFVSSQIAGFISTPKEKLAAVETKTLDIIGIFNFHALPQEQLKAALSYYTQTIFNYIAFNIVGALGSVAKIASFFVITPFILFYFLRDEEKMHESMIKMMPKKYKLNAKKILSDVDDALAAYISSQILVAFIVGVLIFIGYLLIGLNYALLLAVIAFVFNLIPFCGPFISTIPAVFIGLSESPLMAFKVICVVLIVHLFDLNLISPRIVGPRLQLHPVIILLLLVSSVPLVGFLGLFLIVPGYAVAKVILVDLYTMHKSKKTAISDHNPPIEL